MTQTKFCSDCGQKLSYQAGFCSSCGTKIDTAESADENSSKDSVVEQLNEIRVHQKSELKKKNVTSIITFVVMLVVILFLWWLYS